ncbi:helix-turn-helix domain-containing protein [Thioalkalivibrio sp. HK1]|uniref:helix-turn-helix domain-containing protein n=1 Tax=Thioalkalivibrio sp. HK1 TaxID=1469245 RepID=UPI0004728A60|nr:transcriptional regulator [Thioalkalivibrio sp. HK1]
MEAIKPIKSEFDYDRALKRISDLMKSEDQESLDELDILTTLVEAYEQDHHPIPMPDPIEAILFRMEQQNLTPADLEAFIGSGEQVSDILSKKRPLTLEMIRALNAHLGIPAEVLIKEPEKPLSNHIENG